jgi:hypothetical protein
MQIKIIQPTEFPAFFISEDLGNFMLTLKLTAQYKTWIPDKNKLV